jgi:hypothetical protein
VPRMEALGALGFVLLLAIMAAHVVVSIAVMRSRPSRGLVALLLPPLALAWGWQLGARRLVIAYISLLGAFALAIVTIRFMR